MRKYKKYTITLLKKYVFKILNIYYILTTKVKDKKILFLSDTRNKLEGNLKYVFDEINNDYEKIVILKSDRRDKRGFKKTLILLYHLSTSKYIVLDDLNKSTEYMFLRKKQEIHQLWHACGALKKFGYSNHNLKKIHKGYKKYTKVYVSSDNVRENYAEAFQLDLSKIFSLGVPRTDLYFNNKKMEQIKKDFYKQYPDLKNKKIILFAPTYRGVAYKNEYYDLSQIEVEKLYKKIKKDYIFIFKWHPSMANNDEIKKFMLSLKKYDDVFYNFTNYREIEDLLIVSDVLITDYSSCIFEFSLLKKPIIFFVPDLEKYIQEKGLYYDFDDYLIGTVCRDTSDLINALDIKKIDVKKHQEFTSRFMSSCDGKSSKKIVYDMIEGKNKK